MRAAVPYQLFSINFSPSTFIHQPFPLSIILLSTFQPFNLSTFRPFNLSTFRPFNLLQPSPSLVTLFLHHSSPLFVTLLPLRPGEAMENLFDKVARKQVF